MKLHWREIRNLNYYFQVRSLGSENFKLDRSVRVQHFSDCRNLLPRSQQSAIGMLLDFQPDSKSFTHSFQFCLSKVPMDLTYFFFKISQHLSISGFFFPSGRYSPKVRTAFKWMARLLSHANFPNIFSGVGVSEYHVLVRVLRCMKHFIYM
jgi:hypothetical protein